MVWLGSDTLNVTGIRGLAPQRAASCRCFGRRQRSSPFRVIFDVSSARRHFRYCLERRQSFAPQYLKPWTPVSVVAIDLLAIRGEHYGQRSGEPHSKAEHMAAPTMPAT